MSDRTTVTFHPEDRQQRTDPGEDLLEAATNAGVPLEHLCGGNGLCGTCTVRIEEGDETLSDPTEAERELLSAAALTGGTRLACRCHVTDPGTVSVTVPPASRTEGDIVVTDGLELQIDHDPTVTQYHLRLEPPSLSDGRADRKRLLDGINDAYDLAVDTISHDLHRELPARLRAGASDERIDVTATVYDGREIIDLDPGVVDERYGLAIDIGTTTLAVYLIDLQTGEECGVAAGINPQSEYGEDVMSRMRYCRKQDDGREVLQTALRDGLNDCIDELVDSEHIEKSRIYEAVLVGNTAMHHLFLGYDPSHVAGAPYVPARQAAVTRRASDHGLDIAPTGHLHWLPISGGWVGPDKVAVLLASNHLASDATTVCIDIGTNGEISVATDTAVITTSAPAGPALEGAELTYGVRARPGAIDAVQVDPTTFEPAISTIENEAPLGICGSGVIDAIAACFVAGVVDRRGTFTDAATDTSHVIEREDGELAYVLAPAVDAATRDRIVLTQNDIRDVQMAKAAIQAGTRVLLNELDDPPVDRVVVAGGFGNHINVRAALDVGLYPDVPVEHVTSLGNGAGAGARLALLDRSARERAERIVEDLTYHEIAGTDAFESQFLQAMYLPHQRFETCPHVKARIEGMRDPIDVEEVAH